MTTGEPVIPRPAASVLLVRPGARTPIEVYMIRRQKSMRFLGGFSLARDGRPVSHTHLRPQHQALLRALCAHAGAPVKPPPEFGTNDDFQLAQALNRLKGKPVLVSKTAVERKPETEQVN